MVDNSSVASLSQSQLLFMRILCQSIDEFLGISKVGNEVRLGHLGFISKSGTTPCQQPEALPAFIGEAGTCENHRGPPPWGSQRGKQQGVTKRGLVSCVTASPLELSFFNYKMMDRSTHYTTAYTYELSYEDSIHICLYTPKCQKQMPYNGGSQTFSVRSTLRVNNFLWCT